MLDYVRCDRCRDHNTPCRYDGLSYVKWVREGAMAPCGKEKPE